MTGLTDINGQPIKFGDTVKTKQHPGGFLPPGNGQTGIVELFEDKKSIVIRYRKEGRSFDQFICVAGQINEII